MTLATGYGSDLDCGSDLTATMDEVDGFSMRALAQALLRRLDCPRGGLPDDDNYGIDLRSMCNRGMTDRALRSLATQIRGELIKDDRVSSLTVRCAQTSDGSALTVELAVTPVDAVIGTFSLTFDVTDAAILPAEMAATS